MISRTSIFIRIAKTAATQSRPEEASVQELASGSMEACCFLMSPILKPFHDGKGLCSLNKYKRNSFLHAFLQLFRRVNKQWRYVVLTPLRGPTEYEVVTTDQLIVTNTARSWKRIWVYLYTHRVEPNFIFQQNNVPCHKSMLLVIGLSNIMLK